MERDKMLLQLEQECLEVYRRKVDAASLTRSRLHQALASAEAEFSALFSALGEPALSQRVSQSISCLPLRSNSTSRSSGCNTSSIILQWFCIGSVLCFKLCLQRTIAKVQRIVGIVSVSESMHVYAYSVAKTIAISTSCIYIEQCCTEPLQNC